MDARQYAISAAQRTDAALASGRIEEAIRISGEATATLDAEWSRLYNAGDSACDNALIAGNFIAGRHLDALMQGGAADEAYSAAALLLYRSTLAKSKSAALAQSQARHPVPHAVGGTRNRKPAGIHLARSRRDRCRPFRTYNIICGIDALLIL